MLDISEGEQLYIKRGRRYVHYAELIDLNIKHLSARLAAAKERIKELEEALRPFASPIAGHGGAFQTPLGCDCHWCHAIRILRLEVEP